METPVGYAEGRTQKKLRTALEALGFYDVILWPAKGHWRTDSRADVYRWEGQAFAVGRSDYRDGFRVSFCSWETMTACVRFGFELQRDGGASFEAVLKDVV